MLDNLAGFEVKVSPIRFADGEDASEFVGITFQTDKEPELQHKTLIVGGIQEMEGSNQLGYQAWFDGEDNSDELIKKHQETINEVFMAIVTKSLEDTSDSN